MAVVDLDGNGPDTDRLFAWDDAAISRITETSRTTIGLPVGGNVGALFAIDDPFGPALIVTGGFTSISGVPTNSIARYTGVWQPLGGGLRGWGSNVLTAAAVGVPDGPLAGLYVGGLFDLIGGCEHPGFLTNQLAIWGCPHGCYPDCDGSAVLDIFDFLCFQNLFAVADAFADCNQDCTFDIFDFLCFQNNFANGCP